MTKQLLSCRKIFVALQQESLTSRKKSCGKNTKLLQVKIVLSLYIKEKLPLALKIFL